MSKEHKKWSCCGIKSLLQMILNPKRNDSHVIPRGKYRLYKVPAHSYTLCLLVLCYIALH